MASTPLSAQTVPTEDPVDAQRAATQDLLTQVKRAETDDANAAPGQNDLGKDPPVSDRSVVGAVLPATGTAVPGIGPIDTSASLVETSAGDPEAVEPPRPNQDGVLNADGQLTDPAPLDGNLRDEALDQPIDGDISADGRSLAPAQPVEDDFGAPPIVAEADPLDQSDDDADREPDAPRPNQTDLTDESEERPFEALGYELGAFRLFPSITVDETFDDNIFRTSANRSSDWLTTVQPSLAVRSQWSRHSLEAEVEATRSVHKRFASEDDRELVAALRGRLDVTTRSQLDGELGYSFTQPQRGEITTTSAADSGNVIAKTASGSFQQRFNRLVARITGTVGQSDQGVAAALVTDPAICNVAVPPADCATVQQTYADARGAFRLGYEIADGVEVFAEIDGNTRFYSDDEITTAQRSSRGRSAKIGFSVDTSPILKSALALGYTQQTPNDDSLTTLQGAIVEADITWVPTALTTVTLTSRNGISTTALDGSIGALENTGKIAIRHEFRRYFALLAGFEYSLSSYAGIDLKETEFTSKLGLEYAINRRWALLADYTHIDFNSSLADRDYSDNTVRLGLKLQR
jgi:hypothetical protein